MWFPFMKSIQIPKYTLRWKVRKNAETGELNVDVSRIRDLANHDENLALTNQPLNGSKSDQDLKEWAEKKRKKTALQIKRNSTLRIR
jgi:hypothetical protein